MIEESITVETLRALIALDGKTGHLFWRPRGEEWFSNPNAASAWNRRYAGKRALSTNKGDGALHGTLMGRTVMAHRVVWALSKGAWPKRVIDHINGNAKDNRPENLRDVSMLENSRNCKLARNNSSGTHGVSWHERDRRWSVRIAGKYIGSFVEKDDAIAARLNAEREMGFHENHGRPVEAVA